MDDIKDIIKEAEKSIPKKNVQISGVISNFTEKGDVNCAHFTIKDNSADKYYLSTIHVFVPKVTLDCLKFNIQEGQKVTVIGCTSLYGNTLQVQAESVDLIRSSSTVFKERPTSKMRMDKVVVFAAVPIIVYLMYKILR